MWFLQIYVINERTSQRKVLFCFPAFRARCCKAKHLPPQGKLFKAKKANAFFNSLDCPQQLRPNFTCPMHVNYHKSSWAMKQPANNVTLQRHNMAQRPKLLPPELPQDPRKSCTSVKKYAEAALQMVQHKITTSQRDTTEIEKRLEIK